MHYIAGGCRGAPCCAKRQCDRCSREETVCSRRRLSFFAPVEKLPDDAAELVKDVLGDNQATYYEPELNDASIDAGLKSSPLTEPMALSSDRFGRRLQGAGGGGSCRKVTTTYDCNCRCVQHVAQQHCTIRCLPHWRSFIPIMVSLPYAAPGFARPSEVRRAAEDAKAELKGELVTKNSTSKDYQTAKKTPPDLAGLAGSFEIDDSYHLPVYDEPDSGGSSLSALLASGPELHRRFASMVYEHGASRERALQKLEEAHFLPGAVSECFYEPNWDAHSIFIPQSHLAFAHEMGYSLSIWLPFLLSFVGSCLCLYMWRVDPSAKCCAPLYALTFDGRYDEISGLARLKALTGGQFARPAGSTPQGNYVGVYFQYRQTHPIPAQQLSCILDNGPDSQDGTCGGGGVDDVGEFQITGVFRGPFVELTKIYKLGTGNPDENKGHTVTITLTCCDLVAAVPELSAELMAWGMPPGTVGFYGFWKVEQGGFQDIGEMCLWLPPVPVVVGYKVTRTMTTTTSTSNVDTDGDGAVDATVMTQANTTTETVEQQIAMQAPNPYGNNKDGYVQLAA